MQKKNEIKIIIHNTYQLPTYLHMIYGTRPRSYRSRILFLNTDDISHTSNVNNTYYRDKGTNTKIWNFNPKENGIGICWKKCTYIRLQDRTLCTVNYIRNNIQPIITCARNKSSITYLHNNTAVLRALLIFTMVSSGIVIIIYNMIILLYYFPLVLSADLNGGEKKKQNRKTFTTSRPFVRLLCGV